MRAFLGLWLCLWLVFPSPVKAGWTMTVDVWSRDGQPYVPLVRIVRSLELPYEIISEPTALHFAYRGREVSVSNRPAMVISEQLIPVSVTPRWQGQELWVPLDVIQKIFVVQINWRLQTQEVVFTAP